MSRENHVIRAGVLVLAFSTCLALAACSGGSSASATGAVAGGTSSPGVTEGRASAAGAPAGTSGSAGAGCAAVKQDYAALLADAGSNYTSEANHYNTFAHELDDISAGLAPSSQARTDVFDLYNDAELVAYHLDLNGGAVPGLWIQKFDKDLKAVGADCGTAFTSPSLKST
jgi:hypothetical protein